MCMHTSSPASQQIRIRGREGRHSGYQAPRGCASLRCLFAFGRGFWFFGGQQNVVSDGLVSFEENCVRGQPHAHTKKQNQPHAIRRQESLSSADRQHAEAQLHRRGQHGEDGPSKMTTILAQEAHLEQQELSQARLLLLRSEHRTRTTGALLVRHSRVSGDDVMLSGASTRSSTVLSSSPAAAFAHSFSSALDSRVERRWFSKSPTARRLDGWEGP